MLTGFLRTIVLFSVTAVVLRLMGKRQLAQLQPYEVVITLMISDLATLPMADVEIPLLSGVVSILTLLLVHSLLSALSYASVRMRRIICGRPSVLVRDGKICEKELARLCFDLSDLMEGMRSVVPSADKRPATRGEMHLPPVYDGIPLTLILDGQMQERSMRIAGLEPGWLRRILQDHGVARDKDVLIATLDTQGSLLVQEKGGEGRLLTFNAIEPGQVRW